MNKHKNTKANFQYNKKRGNDKMNETNKITKKITQKIYKALEKDLNTRKNSTMVDALLTMIAYYGMYTVNITYFSPDLWKIKDYLDYKYYSTIERRKVTIKDTLFNDKYIILSLFVATYANKINFTEKEKEIITFNTETMTLIFDEVLNMYYNKYKKSPIEEAISRIENLPLKETAQKYKEKARIVGVMIAITAIASIIAQNKK